MGTNTKRRPRDAAASEAGRVMDALRRLVRALRTSAAAVERDAGLSGAQLFVLQQLAERPAASLNELAARTGTHQSTVSVVVSRLVERGLVTRTAAGDDARRVEIALAPAGAALLRAAPPTMQAELLAALHRLSAGERRALRTGLEAWVRAAGLADTEAALFFEDDAARRAP